MKVLFVGYHHNPGGPNEVNRNLLRFLPKNIFYRVDSSKLFNRRITISMLIPFVDVVVFSGVMCNSYEIKLAKILGKRIIYIMHGNSVIETGKQAPRELALLENADKILCVSNTYSEIIKGLYPQFKDKVGVLYNGVNWEEYSTAIVQNPKVERNKKRIILFGGGRPVKRNLEICKAVSELNREQNLDLSVDVYGYYRETDKSPDIKCVPGVSFHHVIPHEQVNKELLSSGLFIQNSDFEPFSLAVTDALGLGCSVLMSKYVGAKDIIPALTQQDIIDNPASIDEIKKKILHVIDNPNNERLVNSINKDATSLEAAAANLIEECKAIIDYHFR